MIAQKTGIETLALDWDGYIYEYAWERRCICNYIMAGRFRAITV